MTKLRNARELDHESPDPQALGPSSEENVEQPVDVEGPDLGDLRRRKAVRWAATTMIAVGLALLALFWMVAGKATVVPAVQAHVRSQQAAEQLQTDSADSPTETLPADNEPWATISIPTIGLADEVILEGTEAEQINVGVGHYTGTEFPWDDSGNVGLAGHRTGWGEPFNELDRLQVGEVVSIETAKATYTYTVTGSTVVDPTEVWVLKDVSAHVTGARQGATTLTLTTCEGEDNEERLIVWAELTDVETGTPA